MGDVTGGLGARRGDVPTKVLLAGRAIWLEIAIALSPLGDSNQATSPSSRRENREGQGSLAQLEVMILRTGNLFCKPVSIATKRWATYALAGAATTLTGASSADAGIHYSGVLGKLFPPEKDVFRKFPLDQPGDSFAFSHRGLSGGGPAYFRSLESLRPVSEDTAGLTSVIFAVEVRAEHFGRVILFPAMPHSPPLV